MRGEKLLEKFGLIDEKYIEEAEEKRVRKNIRAPILIAACFLLVLAVAALPFFKKEETTVHHLVDDDTLPTVTYIPSPVYDGIPYSELDIRDTGLNPELEEAESYVDMDIAPFEEKFISDTVAVIEGRVKDVRVNHYEFATDHDKFKDGGKTVYRWDTVIYEIEVEKIYKGELGTQTVIIEDTLLFEDGTFYLKEDHRYVIPVVYSHEDVAYGLWHGNVTEGSAKRESLYHSMYPYCPPVEVTEDYYYLFPDVWTTFAASENAYRVTMDIPFDGDKSYYNDRMMIIDGVSFEKLFERILTENS